MDRYGRRSLRWSRVRLRTTPEELDPRPCARGARGSRRRTSGRPGDRGADGDPRRGTGPGAAGRRRDDADPRWRLRARGGVPVHRRVDRPGGRAAGRVLRQPAGRGSAVQRRLGASPTAVRRGTCPSELLRHVLVWDLRQGGAGRRRGVDAGRSLRVRRVSADVAGVVARRALRSKQRCSSRRAVCTRPACSPPTGDAGLGARGCRPAQRRRQGDRRTAAGGQRPARPGASCR